MTILLTRLFMVLIYLSISGTCSFAAHIFKIIPFCSINCWICLNCPSVRIALILNPHAVYACITCLIDVISVFFQIEPFGISNVSSILFINTLTADWLSRRIQLFWILALSSILQFKPCTNANHS